ncbi:ABC transporter permease [Terrisporobacter sp.]|uniref:ABC transporter permease n=1 Tax=Terrisporobacter sp. TaxID=1965305 RepID=UPI0026259C23|nr:ABC transporter permease subunit [Terrisporobacter sp.]
MKKLKKNKFYISKIILVIVAICILLPLLNIIIWSFTERWPWPNVFPENYSLRGFKEIFGRKGEMIQLFMSSIMLSMIVAILSVIIGLMSARAFVFYNFKGKNQIYFASILPFLIPCTVFAMGIHVTFIKLGLSNTILGVIIVHLIYSLPYATRLLVDGTEAVGQKLEEQAKVLGANTFQAFTKVTLPILSPVILSALSMSYIVSFSQYFLTLLIGGGKIKTFTIVMFPYISGGDRNIVASYTIVFLGITMIIFSFFYYIVSKFNNNIKTDFYNV